MACKYIQISTRLGKIPMTKITESDVEDFVIELLEREEWQWVAFADTL